MSIRDWWTRQPAGSTQSAIRTVLVAVIAVVVTAGTVTAAVGPVVTNQPAANSVTPPPAPAAYYGQLTIGGDPAPAGTTVVAKIDGETHGTVTTEHKGTYGGSAGTAPKLTVNGSDIEANATVTFYVNGVETSVTDTWQAGTITELNISAPAEAAPSPPSTTPPASPPPTTTPDNGDSGSGTGGSGGQPDEPQTTTTVTTPTTTPPSTTPVTETPPPTSEPTTPLQTNTSTNTGETTRLPETTTRDPNSSSGNVPGFDALTMLAAIAAAALTARLRDP